MSIKIGLVSRSLVLVVSDWPNGLPGNLLDFGIIGFVDYNLNGTNLKFYCLNKCMWKIIWSAHSYYFYEVKTDFYSREMLIIP